MIPKIIPNIRIPYYYCVNIRYASKCIGFRVIPNLVFKYIFVIKITRVTCPRRKSEHLCMPLDISGRVVVNGIKISTICNHDCHIIPGFITCIA